MESLWLSLLEGKGALFIYSGVFLSSFLEYVFPPSPSDTILLFCGFLAGRGAINPLWLFLFYMLGSLAGMSFLYELGLRKGRDFFFNRDLWLFPRDSLIRLDDLFQRYGAAIILSNRIFAGIRAVFFLAAGIGRMSRAKVMLYGLISAVIWGAAIVILGAWVGNRWQQIRGTLSTYSMIVVAAAMILALLYIIRRFRAKRRAP